MPSRRNVLLKLGGSVVTHKGAKDFPLNPNEIWRDVSRFMNTEVVRRICKEVKDAAEEIGYLAIVHGAGVFGHFPVGRYLQADADEQRSVGWTLTMYSVQIENAVLIREMLNNGIPAISIPPRSVFTVTQRDEDRPWVASDASFDSTILRRLLKHYIPVLFGDLVFDRKGDPAVLSGDTILYLFAKELKDVNLVIAGTDVEGIFTDDPKQNPNARFMAKITLSEKDKVSTRENSHRDVDGGMSRKFRELMSITNLGVPSMVIDAFKEGNVFKALKGEHVGTLILP